MNPITATDGYKLDHRRQYPKNTTRVYSNWTPRESRIPGIDHVVHFGLQYFLRKYLSYNGMFGEFFNEKRQSVVDRYARRVNGYLGPNNIGTEHIEALHDLGYVPLEFRALPEGTLVPLRVPMFTVENTHDDFAWVVNYIETLMSSILWLPCTSATQARAMRQILLEAARKTGSPEAFVDWQGHDFSFRGMASLEAAQLSGAGHLIYFTGTDTLPAIDLIEDHYGGMDAGYLIGGSVPATEHSVMCAGGKESEIKTFNRILDLYPAGIVSVVSDTWDLWHVLTKILPQIKDRIMARNGKLVIRPDSGDPADIICGDPKAPEGSPAAKGVVQLLWEVFGGTPTSTNHRLLDQHIGCIYGDSITRARAVDITDRLAAKGFASANIVFGVGSYTYQFVTRDTFGFAQKSTHCRVGNEGRDLFKDPATDSGMKKSAKGRLAVLRLNNGELEVVNQASPMMEASSLLQPVWRNNVQMRYQSFENVRQRARGEIL